MKLSPLDIRRQEFAVKMRGYDREEVKLFLDQISMDWEALLEEQRRTQSRVEELQAKLDHYQKVEEALQEALRTARENAVRTQENARAQAALLVEEAEKKAALIAQNAEREKAEREADARHYVREAERDRSEVRKEIGRLNDRRDQVLARLRSFLISEMEILAKFEEQDPVGYLKFLPSKSESAGVSGQTRPALPRNHDAEARTGVASETPEPPDADLPRPDVDPTAYGGDPGSDFETGGFALPGRNEEVASGWTEPSDEEPPDVPTAGWTVEEVVRPVAPGTEESSPQVPQAASGGQEGEEDSEEMRKIRRILKDLNDG